MNEVERAWMSSQRAIASGIQTVWRNRSRLLVLLAIAIGLVGCVDYDIGIDFRSQTEGAIVQHVRVSDRLSAFDRDTIQSWKKSLSRRAKALGGSVRQRSDGNLDVTIPFINGNDLVEKFDQFFGATETELFVVPDTNGQELPAVTSHLSLVQHNFLLAFRNDLVLDFDLRGLSILSSLPQSPFQNTSARSPVDLSFHLRTPWGVSTPDTARSPDAIDAAKRDYTWTLTPGEMQHFAASFWIPSPIGIGALAIVLLTAIASALKHQVFARLWPGTHAR